MKRCQSAHYTGVQCTLEIGHDGPHRHIETAEPAVPWKLVLAVCAAFIIGAILQVAYGQEPIPKRRHTCITHAGDFSAEVSSSLKLWGQHSAITDCGHVPVANSAPWPDIIVKCINQIGRTQGGVTYPNLDYAYIVIFHCTTPEIQTLIDHEVGHALGIDHTPEGSPITLMSHRQLNGPIHGPFTCVEARLIAILYPPKTTSACSEPEVERSPATVVPPAVGSAPSGLRFKLVVQAIARDLSITLQTLIVQARLGPFDAQLR